MFFDSNGESITLLKERITDSILERKGLTRKQFNTIKHQLVESKYLKESQTVLIPLDKAVDFVRKKTRGERIKEWTQRNWITYTLGCFILSGIILKAIDIGLPMLLPSTQESIEELETRMEAVETRESIHDTIYIYTVYKDTSKSAPPSKVP